MTSVLVFGGAKSGIGQAITVHFLNAGADVTATYDLSNADEKSFSDAHGNVSWVAFDAARAASVDVTTDFKGLDPNHVIDAEFDFYMEKSDAFDVALWNKSLAINLTLPKWIGHHATSTWSRTRSVVFVTSSESNTGSFGAHAYAASKAAVHNLTRSLANSAAGRCRFNSVAAGWIGGVMDTDEVFDMSRRVTPLGRLGAPEEIAETVAWLADDRSSFINGATVFADGGYTGVDTISKYEYEHEYGSLDPDAARDTP